MQVSVRDNNVDQALRALKKKLQREGVFREMKLKQHFEKPSEKKAREKAEAIRRARKLASSLSSTASSRARTAKAMRSRKRIAERSACSIRAIIALSPLR